MSKISYDKNSRYEKMFDLNKSGGYSIWERDRKWFYEINGYMPEDKERIEAEKKRQEDRKKKENKGKNKKTENERIKEFRTFTYMGYNKDEDEGPYVEVTTGFVVLCIAILCITMATGIANTPFGIIILLPGLIYIVFGFLAIIGCPAFGFLLCGTAETMKMLCKIFNGKNKKKSVKCGIIKEEKI